MSLDAMEEEIANQIEDLPRFVSQLEKQRFLHVAPSELVFTGSGDSHAVALFAQQLSDAVALASDPYELSLIPDRARGKHVVLISVSGRTKANLQLARKLKGVAREKTAVTANPDSPLGKLCDQRIILQYRSAGRLTSGTVSFTTSLLACAHILGELPAKVNVRDVMRKASEWAKGVRTPLSGGFLFVGSGVNHTLAEYGACKIHEVLGAKAGAQFPEQVGHAQLFSINRAKDTIVCIGNGGNDKTRKLASVFQQGGFRVHTIFGHSSNFVVRSLEISLHLQHLTLNLAKMRGMKECAFLVDDTRLQLSNRLIY